MDKSGPKPVEAPLHARTMAKNCVCFGIRRAARAVTRMYDDALRPAGIRSTQLAILNAVRLIGPLSVKRLAAATVIDRTTLTRSLKLLEREELVRIEAGDDRREKNVTLTDNGAAKLELAFPMSAAAQAGAELLLGPENMTRLQEMLKGLVGATRKTGRRPT